jgi:4-hydroxy-4-methyl-2-oxoglutarate aldolase
MKTIRFSIALTLVLLTQVSPPPSSEVLPAKYLADATEQLTGHRAHMTNEIQLLAGTSLAGPAFTMRIVRDETASRSVEGLTAIKAMETISEGSVVVVALDDEKDFAVFGATFALLAKSRNLAGFVIDGSVRSLPSLRRMEFPTFARGTVPGSAGGHYRLDALNVPIFCGGLTVKPGDFVVADADGVTVVPKERYEEILPLAKKMQSEDQAILPLIEKYHSFTKAWLELNAAKQP